jgi:hypothetical protein
LILFFFFPFPVFVPTDLLIMPGQTEIAVSSVLATSLPPTNLYFMSISRIHQVKRGPFHEHSSQLHSIAVGVPNWGKVNSGLFKMYEVSDSSLFFLLLASTNQLGYQGRNPWQKSSGSAYPSRWPTGMGRSHSCGEPSLILTENK